MVISCLYVQTVIRQCFCFPNSQWGTTAHDTKYVALELKDVPFKVHGYSDFPKDGVAVVAKLKSAKDNQLVQTLILHLFEDGKTTVQLTNHSKENWKIKQGDLMGCFDMRSYGYFHVSRDTLQQIMQSSFKTTVHF